MRKVCIDATWVLVLFTATLSVPNGEARAETKSLIDSKVWIGDWSPTNVYWLDNARVLFASSQDMTYRTANRPAIAIWEIGKPPRHHKEDARLECYASGILWYSAAPSATAHFRGPLGKEAPYAKPPGRYVQADREINCGYVDLQALHTGGRIGRVLLPNHGYLDLGASEAEKARANQAVIHTADNGRQTVLPLRSRELRSIKFFEFSKAYFIVSQYFDPTKSIVSFPWPHHLPQPLWWLRPNGETTQILVPADSKWNKGGSVTFVPVQRGIAVVYHGGTKSLSDPGDQGLYLLSEGKTQKLLTGYIEGAGVSPDGCRLAFAHAPNLASNLANPSNRRTLKTLNVCNQGG